MLQFVHKAKSILTKTRCRWENKTEHCSFSSFVSIAVMKPLTKSSLREERIYLAYTSRSSSHKTHFQELRKMKCPGCLLSSSFLPFYIVQVPSLGHGIAHSGRDPLRQLAVSTVPQDMLVNQPDSDSHSVWGVCVLLGVEPTVLLMLGKHWATKVMSSPSCQPARCRVVPNDFMSLNWTSLWLCKNQKMSCEYDFFYFSSVFG